nr:hypothetical protein [Aureimonas sp. AU20]
MPVSISTGLESAKMIRVPRFLTSSKSACRTRTRNSSKPSGRSCPRPHCLPQALADGLKKRVARPMPQPAVHLLEAVEIEMEKGATLRRRADLVEGRLQGPPVAKRLQRLVEGLLAAFDLRSDRLDRGGAVLPDTIEA